jgi:MFS family permease
MPSIFSKHYVACMICGAAMQMSFFLTFFNVDLFQYFFPDYDPEFWLSLSISLASVSTSALMVWRPILFGSYRITLVVGYVGSAFFSAVVPCILLLTSASYIPSQIGFIWLILNKFIIGVFQAIAGGSLFSYFGTHLSDWCVQSAQAGTPLGGLIIYFTHLLLKVTLGGSRAAFLKAAFIQFAMVVFMLLLAFRISNWLTSFQRQPIPSSKDALSHEERLQPLLAGAINNQESTYSRWQDLKIVYGDVWKPCLCYVLVLCINQSMFWSQQ